MDLTGLVLRDGVVARASGRVLVVGDTAWFEDPLPVQLLAFPQLEASEPGPLAIRVHGVDPDRLDRRVRYADGGIEGWATLTGVVRQREMHVRDQEPMSWPTPVAGRWTTPPCPPPVAGWPTGPHYLVSHPPAPAEPPDDDAGPMITQETIFRPPGAHPVMVVAAEDPARVEPHLRWRYGESLCVVRSRYRQREIDETRQRLSEEMSLGRWPMPMACGRSAGEDGQPLVSASFAWIEPDIAEWVATVPDGLLDVQIWLVPIG